MTHEVFEMRLCLYPVLLLYTCLDTFERYSVQRFDLSVLDLDAISADTITWLLRRPWDESAVG